MLLTFSLTNQITCKFSQNPSTAVVVCCGFCRTTATGTWVPVNMWCYIHSVFLSSVCQDGSCAGQSRGGGGSSSESPGRESHGQSNCQEVLPFFPAPRKWWAHTPLTHIYTHMFVDRPSTHVCSNTCTCMNRYTCMYVCGSVLKVSVNHPGALSF